MPLKRRRDLYLRVDRILVGVEVFGLSEQQLEFAVVVELFLLDIKFEHAWIALGVELRDRGPVTGRDRLDRRSRALRWDAGG